MIDMRSRVRSRLWSSAAIALVALTGVAAADLSLAATNPVSEKLAEIRGKANFDRSYAPLVEAVTPAVVNVRVERNLMPSSAEMPQMPQIPDLPNSPFGPDMREFFKKFFGPEARPMPRVPRHQVAAGSGFIIDSEGHAVTNAHVVKGGTKITVTTHDGDEYEAKLVGIDERTDLALLKIEGDGPFPYVEFADSDKVRVGDKVIAVGNPFGLGGSVTAGIVSAKGREIGAGPYDDFIQLDAPINRGNSGGPTFNLDGQVIGVNTLIFSPSGGNVGVAFAISSNLAKEVVYDLMDDGRIERGWLGVRIQALDEDMAKALGLEKPEGALVSSVEPDSPAAAAGLKPGDVILAFNGKKISTLRDLTRAVAKAGPGAKAKIEILRGGDRETVTATLGEMPTETVARATPEAESGQPKLGLMLAPLDESTRRELGVERSEGGVVVAGVQPNGPAAEKGIREGDVILSVGSHKVKQPKDVVEAVKKAFREGRKAVLLRILRDGETRFVAVPLAVS